MLTETSGRTETVLGIGELKATRLKEEVLSCIGLGSCVAVCLYDRVTRTGGMVHVVLPSHEGSRDGSLSRYADTAVPLLVEEMLRAGAIRSRITARIAGGAQMSLAPGLKNVFKTGERNVQEVKAALVKAALPLSAEDVGGSKGRSIRLFMESGRVTVKTAMGDEKEL